MRMRLGGGGLQAPRSDQRGVTTSHQRVGDAWAGAYAGLVASCGASAGNRVSRASCLAAAWSMQPCTPCSHTWTHTPAQRLHTRVCASPSGGSSSSSISGRVRTGGRGTDSSGSSSGGSSEDAPEEAWPATPYQLLGVPSDAATPLIKVSVHARACGVCACVYATPAYASTHSS